MKKIKIFIPIIGIVLIVVFLLFYFLSDANIKVITSSSGSWIYSGKMHYYKITRFGNVWCRKFEGNAKEYLIVSDSSGYTLEVDSEEGYIKYEDEQLDKYVNNIIDLVKKEKLKYPDIGSLYIVNNRYFISVLDNSPKNSFYTILYEYDLKNNNLKKISKFKGQNIKGIYVNS